MNKIVMASEFDFTTDKDKYAKRAYGKLSSIEGKTYKLPSSGKEAFSMKSDTTGKISVWVKDLELIGGHGTIYKPIWSSIQKNPGLSGWTLLLK